MPIQNNCFNFCPECGGRNIALKATHWLCADCGFDLYNNVATAVGAIMQDNSGRILLEIRSKEPRKGFLALPGGFAGPDESLEEAVIRECNEETSVRVHSVEYVCSFPNNYEYNGIMYKTCDVFFTAALPTNAALQAQESEVAGFQWAEISCSDDIEDLPLAFESARRALRLWYRTRSL